MGRVAAYVEPRKRRRPPQGQQAPLKSMAPIQVPPSETAAAPAALAEGEARRVWCECGGAAVCARCDAYVLEPRQKDVAPPPTPEPGWFTYRGLHCSLCSGQATCDRCGRLLMSPGTDGTDAPGPPAALSERYSRCSCGGHAECTRCDTWMVAPGGRTWPPLSPRLAEIGAVHIGCTRCGGAATCHRCGERTAWPATAREAGR